MARASRVGVCASASSDCCWQEDPDYRHLGHEQLLKAASIHRNPTTRAGDTRKSSVRDATMESKKSNSEKKNIDNLTYADIQPVSPNAVKETREFLQRVTDIMLDFVTATHNRSAKILDFHHPEDLKKILDLEIHEHPLPLKTILKDCEDTFKYQVKTGHPHFYNQLTTGLETVSLAGEWVSATANTNMFTYEIAPVFILMEQVVLKKMRDIIGFHHGDSILAPGGSISNLYATMAARHKMFPECKQKGNACVPQLIMFTSEHSHYSIKGAGMVMGFGAENVIHLECDARGRIIPEILEKSVLEEIRKGNKPFFVNCTCGTTVMGAFDPIQPIADICDKYGMWLHVDAAWGGGCLLSKKHKHLLDGIERADSVTWNPHKLMGTLLQCSTIHFKEDGLLFSCNQLSADYLFQQDKHYDVSYDTGDKVIQCGRHNDIFKLWLSWRSKGDTGYEKMIDGMYELTDYMVKRMKEKKNEFYLILEPELTNVCFWYIPPSLRKMPHGPEKEKRLGEITPKIKARMMNCGTMMIGYQPQGDIPNFFRTIISKDGLTEKDIDFMMDELDRLGKDL